MDEQNEKIEVILSSIAVIVTGIASIVKTVRKDKIKGKKSSAILLSKY